MCGTAGVLDCTGRPLPGQLQDIDLCPTQISTEGVIGSETTQGTDRNQCTEGIVRRRLAQMMTERGACGDAHGHGRRAEWGGGGDGGAPLGPEGAEPRPVGRPGMRGAVYCCSSCALRTSWRCASATYSGLPCAVPRSLHHQAATAASRNRTSQSGASSRASNGTGHWGLQPPSARQEYGSRSPFSPEALQQARPTTDGRRRSGACSPSASCRCSR